MGASISSGEALSSFSRDPFVPTVDDVHAALRALSQLVPPELAIVILEEAQYWVMDSTVSSRHVVVRAGAAGDLTRSNLVSAPIRPGATAHPLRRVRFTAESRDQGFSSFPQHRNTREGSSSWFEAALIRRNLQDGHDQLAQPSKYSVVIRETLYHNLHATPSYHSHTHELPPSSEIMLQARENDRIAVYAAAQYPLWVNDVKSSRLTIEYAAV